MQRLPNLSENLPKFTHTINAKNKDVDLFVNTEQMTSY